MRAKPPHPRRVFMQQRLHWGWLDTVPGFPDRLRENPPRQGFFEHPEYLAVRAHLPAPWQDMALLHESSRARTMPTDRILTGRCDTTLVGRGRSSDSRSHSRGRPHSPAQLDSGREGHRR